MDRPADTVFDASVWGPALEKYGAVVQMSVALYGADEQVICEPCPATPIATVFETHHYDPGVFLDCVRQCLAQRVDNRTPVVVTPPSGLAVVGVSLVRDGRAVAVLVGGYTPVGFCDSVAIARLARESGAPFAELWSVARSQQPISVQRLILSGELLQVLGDTLLRENDLRRHSEAAAQQFSHLASHDSLTDLPNRLLMADRLVRALVTSRRNRRRVAVLFLDVDHFKSINDSLGHNIGDELLRSIARVVTTCVRTSDTVSRHGGDEFVVLLADLDEAEDAGVSAQKILAALSRPHRLAGHELHVTVSIGIAVYPDDGKDAESLLKAADLALFQSKEHGRNSYQFFRPELNARAVERQAVEAGLHVALDNQEFELFYQPKMDLRTGAIVGAEALIRWRHPERGLVEPDKFVTIAEDCGLIKPIGRWVMHEACRQAQAWQDAGLRPIPVSVNVSALEFRGEGFADNTVEALRKTGLDPRYLEIELTESALMAHAEASTAMLHQLKNIGVQLAIDDFGTGWSSLSYLRHFPIDALKVDKSFVQEIAAGPSSAPIVKAVISMGKSLNHRVIAEGVETRDQLAFLQAEDCGEGQGFLFSQPLMPGQFARLLESGSYSNLVSRTPAWRPEPRAN